jgi:hypothetical protein
MDDENKKVARKFNLIIEYERQWRAGQKDHQAPEPVG